MERNTIIIIVVVVIVCLCVSGAIYYFTRGDSSTPAAKQSNTPPQPSPWKCLAGINVPLRKNVGGDVECMSQNNKDCLWKSNESECKLLLSSPPSDLKPLVCGDMHKSQWGDTGYDNPIHWCAKGKLQL
jgi:hypothetical protein